jgi:autotransporter-associated beta strand protein
MIMRASQTLGTLILAGALIAGVPEFAAGQSVEVDRELGGSGRHITASTHITRSTHSGHTHGAGAKHKSPPPVGGDPTWTGTTDSKWNTTTPTTNWNPNTVPTSGMTATFSGAGNGHTTIDLSGTAVVVLTISFDTSSAAAYTIGSGAVNIQSLSLNNGGAITMSSTVAANQLFNAAISLGTENKSNATFTFTNDSLSNTLTFAGTITADTLNNTGSAGTKTLLLNGAGNGVISGVIQDGKALGAVTKSGTGTWTLSGANTYTGGTNINQGTILIGVSNVGTTSGALGPSTAAVNLGDTTGTSENASLLTNGAFTFSNNITVQSGNSGTATIGGNSANSSTFSGAINLNKNLTVTAVNAGTVNLTGSISNSTGTNTVNITGAGTSNVVLNNTTTSNQFAPTTFSINSGKLSLGASNQIGNSTNVTVNNGGTLNTAGFSEGSSTVGSTAGIGALTLAGGSTIDFKAGANGSTILAFSGAVSGAGTISILDWTGTARIDTGAAGNDRLLFVNDPNFSSSQLAQFQFYNDSGTAFATGAMEIVYDGFFELVPVPEPGTWCAAALAMGVIGYSQRRRFTRLLKLA